MRETAKARQTEETSDLVDEADTKAAGEVYRLIEEVAEAAEVAEEAGVVCRHKQPHFQKTHTCQATE